MVLFLFYETSLPGNIFHVSYVLLKYIRKYFSQLFNFFLMSCYKLSETFFEFYLISE